MDHLGVTGAFAYNTPTFSSSSLRASLAGTNGFAPATTTA
jgi:hypothetical protein